jgi:NAD(P)-dependent dehydrogenase (short-subunit alcohol dehydrogenase family)
VNTSRGPGSVLVSGAARGIGRATAELLLARAWRVGMYDVDAAADAGDVPPTKAAVTPDWANRLVVTRTTR